MKGDLIARVCKLENRIAAIEESLKQAHVTLTYKGYTVETQDGYYGPFPSKEDAQEFANKFNGD